MRGGSPSVRSSLRALRVLGAAGITLSGLLLASCSNQPHVSSTSTTHPPAVSGTSTTEAPQSTVALYFLRDDGLGVADRPLAASTTDPHLAVLHDLLTGPTALERAAGLSSPFVSGTRLRDLSIGGGVAVAQFNPALFETASAAVMRARIASIVFTLTQFPAIEKVQFTLGGANVASFAGYDLSKPIGRDSVASALPPLLVESPAIGDSVHNPLVVHILSNVTGAYSIELFDASGKQILNALGTTVPGATLDDAYPFTAGAPGSGRLKVFVTTAQGSSTTVLDISIPVGP